MASGRDIRRRIRSISSTSQITRAMQMVAASKMRKAQQAAIEVRPFVRMLYRIQRVATTHTALVDEEFEPGLVAVAAPVRDFRGRVVAALNVSGPKFRLADRLEEAGHAVADAAGRMSELLGWQRARTAAPVGTDAG